MTIVDLKLVPGYLPAHGTTREALLTRGPMKHLARYVDEFAFRLNEGNVARHSSSGWLRSWMPLSESA